MSGVGGRFTIVLALLGALLPAIVAVGQEESEQEGTSPATRHAQVISHGVVTVPSDDVAWRLGVKQAQAADRSTAETHAAGFIVAGDGDVAVTDAEGEVLAWLGPGEATWTDAGAERAVVSAAGDRVEYLDIALVPATRAAGGAGKAATASFTLPAGEAFDVDLIRDVLERSEESVIPAATAPMLLVVTGGKVFVQHASGEIEEISAGSFAQVEGDVVVTGASRAPASFVVARIGSSASERVALQNARATPIASPVAMPLATPVGASSAAAVVHIAAFVCPVDYEGRAVDADCAEPAAGVAFSIEAGGEAVASKLTDPEGELSFRDVAAGEYILLAGAPGGVASSKMECQDRAGNEIGTVAGPNEITLTLKSGDDIACIWSIVPVDERFGHASLSVAIRACPAGMTPARFDPDACTTAPPGTKLTLHDRESGKPLGEATKRADNWKWDGLEPHAYDLEVNALPSGLTDSALDDQPCCGAEHDFTVLMPKGSRRVTRMLFLFPPDVPRESSLTVLIHACPPGMTPGTLVAELCEPAPPGTTLSLREQGITVGVAAAGSDAWRWDGLGALPYHLSVNAIPPGFTGYQLDDQPCCEDEGGLPVTVPDEPVDAEQTLFLFQPPIAGDEVDSDDDGLFDAQEAELGTQPFLADTDEDGLGDGDEVDFYGTDPLRPDTDDDGLDDLEEVQTHGTNPFLADTDGDGVPDAKEIAAASDPLDTASTPATPTPIPTATPLPTATPAPTATALPTAAGTPTFDLGLATPVPDVASPTLQTAVTPRDDLDGDGLTTLEEITIYGANPIVADTDGDGVDDGDEIATGADPLDAGDR